ncbi:MAG: group I intron-associated PD-(D/E)XK endonuclease, partial [bacterium]
PYSRAQIDLLAAYVEPFDTWYLIPVEAFTPATTIRLSPHRPSHRKFERFREAWGLLRE